MSKNIKKGDFVLLDGKGGYARIVSTSGESILVDLTINGKVRYRRLNVDYVPLPKNLNGGLRRTHAKGPFWLYSATPHEFGSIGGMSYTIIFEDRGKVRIGTVDDCMHCRYGIQTFGSLSSPESTGLWQVRPGAVKEDQLDAMISVFDGVYELPEWGLVQLKNLVW